MSVPSPFPNRRRKLLVTIVVAVVATLVVVYRGHVGCYLFYAECNPLLSVPEMPGWNVPTNPVEKAGYDFAHALKLPEGVPEPVPFDFKAARIKAIEANVLPFEIHQHVAEQYFDHLCSTEAGTQIFERVRNVDGFRLLRTPFEVIDEPEDHERYSAETAFRFRGGGHSEVDHWVLGWPEYFVQPVKGSYLFMEQPEVDRMDLVIRFTRGLNSNPPFGYQNGLSIYRKIGGVSRHFNLPLMIVQERQVPPIARYGITWRGIRRARDREFAVAGGEVIVVDLAESKVLAIDREFVLSGRDRRPSRIWWANAKNCRFSNRDGSFVYLPSLVEEALVPKPNVNAEFISVPKSDSEE